MKFTKTKIEGAWIIEPKVFEDERGSFCEKWNYNDFSDLIGVDHGFAQMNQSKSKENVLRGLHYQSEHPQAKLVWTTTGIILDVFVDLRKDSPTYGKWDSYRFGIKNRNHLLYVPAGCAHGFMVQSSEGHFNYLVSDYRYPEYERTLMWNDPYLNIDWNLQKPNKTIRVPILSDKDKQGHYFL
jgi:dTDP-4-dehydrorhamnose 3,5-epimerase